MLDYTFLTSQQANIGNLEIIKKSKLTNIRYEGIVPNQIVNFYDSSKRTLKKNRNPIELKKEMANSDEHNDQTE